MIHGKGDSEVADDSQNQDNEGAGREGFLEDAPDKEDDKKQDAIGWEKGEDIGDLLVLDIVTRPIVLADEMGMGSIKVAFLGFLPFLCGKTQGLRIQTKGFADDQSQKIAHQPQSKYGKADDIDLNRKIKIGKHRDEGKDKQEESKIHQGMKDADQALEKKEEAILRIGIEAGIEGIGALGAFCCVHIRRRNVVRIRQSFRIPDEVIHLIFYRLVDLLEVVLELCDRRGPFLEWEIAKAIVVELGEQSPQRNFPYGDSDILVSRLQEVHLCLILLEDPEDRSDESAQHGEKNGSTNAGTIDDKDDVEKVRKAEEENDGSSDKEDRGKDKEEFLDEIKEAIKPQFSLLILASSVSPNTKKHKLTPIRVETESRPALTVSFKSKIVEIVLS